MRTEFIVRIPEKKSFNRELKGGTKRILVDKDNDGYSLKEKAKKPRKISKGT
jgi:hypothetical protein